MGTANLNLSIIEKRMMTESEASSYCGLHAKHFKTTCPVPLVNLGGKAMRYDKRDLDRWIDTEKSGDADTSHESILARLE